MPLRPFRTSYRLGARLTRALPARARYGVAGLGGALWWALDAGRRRNACANYAAVLGLPEDHPEVREVVRRAFENYGRMLADFVLIGDLDPQQIGQLVTIHGREHVDEAIGTGRGVILVLPHMGSWDLAGAVAGVLGYRVAAVAARFPGSLNEAVVETRAACGVEVIPMGRAAIRSIGRVLDENGLVALACDLPQGPGVDVRFFGRRAVVPSGPAAIACRRGSPLVPLYTRREDGTRYHLHLDPPIETPSEGRPGKEVVAEVMQQVIDRFEVFIRAHPDQWYAFRRVLH